MSEIWPDSAEWLDALQAARRRAPAPDASVEPEIAALKASQPRVKPLRGARGSALNPNPQGETPVKPQTEPVVVRGVALDPVEARVDHLRRLNEHMVNRYLDLAVALYAEHINSLWTQAVAPGGGRYTDEETFWENLGVKRRTAYQLISVGAVLALVSETGGEPTTPAIQAEAAEILLPVGLAKLDVVVPVLKRDPVLSTVRRWSDLARANSRDALRELVAKALGRKLKDEADPGEKFRRYIINAMPDGETRELAIAFFEAGELYTKSNPIGTLICAMSEVLVEWSKAKVDEPAA